MIVIGKTIFGNRNVRKLQKHHLLNAIGLMIGKMLSMNLSVFNVMQKTYLLGFVVCIMIIMKTDIGSFFAVMHAKHHFTRNCFASSYINDWHQMMDYKVDRPYVFTGVYSYHSNKNE